MRPLLGRAYVPIGVIKASVSITRLQGTKSLKSLQREGEAVGDGAVRNKEVLNTQKHSRGNSVCKGTEI